MRETVPQFSSFYYARASKIDRASGLRDLLSSYTLFYGDMPGVFKFTNG